MSIQQPTGYVPVVRPMKYVKKIKEPSTPVLCEICNLKLNSTSQAEVHLKGQNHLKAVKKLEKASSEQCSEGEMNGLNNTVDFNSTIQNIPVIQPSSQTVSDKSDENNTEGGKSEHTEPNQKRTKTLTYVYCEVCMAKFNSQAQADDHFKGLRHLKKLKLMQKSAHIGKREFYILYLFQYQIPIPGQTHRSKIINLTSVNKEMIGNVNGWFYCNSCNISCPTSAALHNHVMTMEHKSNVGFKNSQLENTYINCSYPIPY
ncbi:hypothetical protein HELRODRAFT_160492 [Helobdella robusta]|uniref:C2H2-type domain-containing protein n=1 Tax=Helobdella robusta TaxID=6412 RepID=T1EQB2_HELRO|nr:hypothetical protein HELRODRAFT_160492 [Helobdella robusta]ESO06328.1 hypothetical protein HELRODRAFT_160492 [Helobdella robusta]